MFLSLGSISILLSRKAPKKVEGQVDEFTDIINKPHLLIALV